MTKEKAAALAEVTEKYSFAICFMLYPTQTERLYSHLDYYMKYDNIPKIDDSFVRLAFMMIVSDLMWQERQERKNFDNKKQLQIELERGEFDERSSKKSKG